MATLNRFRGRPRWIGGQRVKTAPRLNPDESASYGLPVAHRLTRPVQATRAESRRPRPRTSR